jgi:hypothetical protein
MVSKKTEPITKKIRLDHDGGITIFYGDKEKFGRCIHDMKEFCGVWCPLFPVPLIYSNDPWDTKRFLRFVCHGYEQGVYVEVKM